MGLLPLLPEEEEPFASSQGELRLMGINESIDAVKGLALAIFDWDGTLADSHRKILACFEKTISTLALEPRLSEQVRETIGLSLRETVGVLYPDAKPDLAEHFIAAYRDHWLAPTAPKAKLFAGARECVASLRAAGIQTAIATGKSRAGLNREMRESAVVELFDTTRCSDETNPKPHPQMVLDLLALTSTRPSSAVVIGDATFDLEMAQAAGVPSIGVECGAHSAADLTRFNPLTILEDVSALVPWLLARR